MFRCTSIVAAVLLAVSFVGCKKEEAKKPAKPPAGPSAPVVKPAEPQAPKPPVAPVTLPAAPVVVKPPAAPTLPAAPVVVPPTPPPPPAADAAAKTLLEKIMEMIAGGQLDQADSQLKTLEAKKGSFPQVFQQEIQRVRSTLDAAIAAKKMAVPAVPPVPTPPAAPALPMSMPAM